MNWIKRDNHNKNSSGEKKYPFVKWVCLFFLALSILLLIYTYYRSEIVWQGAKNEKYFTYYMISLVGILFWGFVLKLRSGIQANITILTITLFVGLYAGEASLNFFEYEKSYSRSVINAAANLGVKFDQRSTEKVIDDLIAQGVDAVPAVGPRNVLTMDAQLLPLGGFSNKTNVAQNENGYFMVYKSDRYGFNNPDSEWDASHVEWLLIGDSFAEGRAVRPGEDIAGQIRANTLKSSISLGRGGNGPLMELAALIEYARAVKPRRVLWVYYEENDLRSDLRRDKTVPLLMKYVDDDFFQNLIHRQKEIDKELEEYILKPQAGMNKSKWIRLTQVRREIRKVRSFFDEIIYDKGDVDVDVDVDVEDPIFAKILTKAKTEVDRWGGKLYFVYLPEYVRYSTKIISHDKFRKKAEVTELVKELGIQVIDIHQEVFVNHPDPLALFPFRLNGHYNADGYSEVAKAIVTSVNKYE